MSEFERTQVVDVPGRTVPFVSPHAIENVARGNYEASYHNLVKGVASSRMLKEYFERLSTDNLGKTIVLLREEALRVEHAGVFPYAVSYGISSVWQSLAVVWMHEANTEQFHPLNAYDEQEVLCFFPMERFLTEVTHVIQPRETSAWNTSQKIKYAGILMDADFYRGYETLKETDPETYQRIFRDYTAGSQIGWNRYRFLENNKFFSTQA